MADERKPVAIDERATIIEHALDDMRKQLEKELPSENATMDQIEAASGKIGASITENLRQQMLSREPSLLTDKKEK